MGEGEQETPFDTAHELRGAPGGCAVRTWLDRTSRGSAFPSNPSLDVDVDFVSPLDIVLQTILRLDILTHTVPRSKCIHSVCDDSYCFRPPPPPRHLLCIFPYAARVRTLMAQLVKCTSVLSPLFPLLSIASHEHFRPLLIQITPFNTSRIPASIHLLVHFIDCARLHIHTSLCI